MTKAEILIVEDEGIVAKDIMSRLTALGFVAERWFTTGERAIAAVAESPPDLVLMDIQLHGTMDGVEAAEKIQNEHDVPVVYLTAHADPATLDRAGLTEPFGYVLKPFEERELRAAVELALAKHRADRALRQREQWLTTTLRSVGEAVVATDIDGRITLFNPGAVSLTCWKTSEASGQRVEKVLNLQSNGRALAGEHPIRQALASGADVELGEEIGLQTKDARLLPVGGIIAPIRDERGNVSGSVCVLRDLSRQRAQEKRMQQLLSSVEQSNNELKSEKDFLAALFESMPVPVVVVNTQGEVRSVNAAISSQFDSKLETRGRVLPGELLHCVQAVENPGLCDSMEPCESCELRKIFNETLAGASVRRRRVEFDVASDGGKQTTIFLVSSAPLTYKRERLAIVLLEDVTELEGLRRLVKGASSFAGMIGSHPQMLEIYETIREIADIPSPVLISGESGTGKELVARAIHSSSSKPNRPFVAVNCAALPEGLLESELFGHVKGAFTGATRDKKGRFELADGGTIFLDEIGELPLSLQVKLLRVLQEQSFERVGGEKTVSVNIRILSATNRDLPKAISSGEFREDLYYRLCVVPIHVPPLRERIEDIPLLAEHALQCAATLASKPKPELDEDAVAALVEHAWPGNVRELQNAMEYALIKARGGVVKARHLPPPVLSGRAKSKPVVRRRGAGTRLTPESVSDALHRCGGNKSKAAKLLGVSRATLYRFFDASD